MDAKAIRDLRKAIGYSQGELAEILEVAVSSVSRWERGKNKPHRWVYQRLLRMAKERQVKRESQAG